MLDQVLFFKFPFFYPRFFSRSSSRFISAERGVEHDLHVRECCMLRRFLLARWRKSLSLFSSLPCHVMPCLQRRPSVRNVELRQEPLEAPYLQFSEQLRQLHANAKLGRIGTMQR